MNGLVRRPQAVFDPARGLLRSEHFQVSWVTDDLDRACDIFTGRFGIREFGGIEGETPAGGYIRVKLAWVGSTMYELVACSGPGSEMYNEVLPDSGPAIRFHHLGFLVGDRQSWDGLMETIDRGGWEIRQANNTEGFMRHCYIYVAELGHYCEYMFCERAGIEFFENVPAS